MQHEISGAAITLYLWIMRRPLDLVAQVRTVMIQRPARKGSGGSNLAWNHIRSEPAWEEIFILVGVSTRDGDKKLNTMSGLKFTQKNVLPFVVDVPGLNPIGSEDERAEGHKQLQTWATDFFDPHNSQIGPRE